MTGSHDKFRLIVDFVSIHVKAGHGNVIVEYFKNFTMTVSISSPLPRFTTLYTLPSSDKNNTKNKYLPLYLRIELYFSYPIFSVAKKASSVSTVLP